MPQALLSVERYLAEQGLLQELHKDKQQVVCLAVSRVATWGVLPQRRRGEDRGRSPDHGLAVTGISANVLRSFGLGFVTYLDMHV